MLRRKRKSKLVAPALISFTLAVNVAGCAQPCVYAQCQYGGCTVGPIWGQSDASIGRALATLTRSCVCGRRRHRCRGVEGAPVVQ